MAESAAVSFLLNKLSGLLSEERHLLGGLEREVQSIQYELLQINQLLRGFMERDDSNSNVEWIGELRDNAYDVEDILDKYMLRFQRRRGATGITGCIKKAYASVKNLQARHHIASEIQSIKCKLQSVFERQQRFRDMNASIDQGSSSTLPKNECSDGRGDALFTDEDDVVGIEKPKEKLLEWICSMDDGLEVISVVGMGGLGKTTLVKKVYDDESVKKLFNHHVKMIASEYKDDKHMLATLIKKLVGEIMESPPQELEGMSDGEMKEFISNFLKEKNYVIVLDDVWDISKWDAIRPALPKRGTHGCVIITTRSHSIANAACSETDHVYELKPLPEDESRELFHKKAFPKNPCPDYIREYAEKILKRCQGLPLAICVIGGLLATKDNSAEEWEMFERELKGGGSLKKIRKSVISLSYNDLPYYLKYCYLYLSIFPEDRLLEKETIIRLWIAEGFVVPKQDMTMEEVAVAYLSELFSRSLIQVAKRSIDGRATDFRIHDLLRDFIVSKSGEHNIVTISNRGEMQWPSRVRRLAIQKSYSLSQDTDNLKCLRSLLLVCSGNVDVGVISELVRRCRLLKVLELRGAPLECIPNEVFKLLYLKHLSLRNTKVKLIQQSIKYLVNLETLDLKNCNVTELPKEILELHKLRNLLVYTYKSDSRFTFDSIQSFKAPCDIGRSLPLLLKLCCIEANESDGMKIVKEIGELTQLRRLGIRKLRSGDGKDLCSSIAKLTNLRSLLIHSFEEGEKLDLDYSVSLPFLRCLYLKGCIEKVPEWISSLNGLTFISLSWSRLREDPLNSLQDLPNLARLHIHDAYVDGLRFKAQGFQKLKDLRVEELRCLKWVIVETGSMPGLQGWAMRDCKLVTELPQGIQHLLHLQRLNFCSMGDEFVESAVKDKRNEIGVNSRLAHVPNVRFFYELYDGSWSFDFAL
ncbi:hypothetical protein ACS0TY_017513 [Phlomoides rotata]